MDAETLSLFILTVVAIVAVPGPNVLLIVNDSMAVGLRKSLATIMGVNAGTLAVIGLSLAGVATLLSLHAHLYLVLKLAGAGYLVYLGVAIIRSRAIHSARGTLHQRSGNSLFLRGLLVALSNPKGFLFAAAFFPQFISKTAPLMPQLVVLMTCFLITATMVELAYAFLAARGGNMILSQNFDKFLSKLSGSIFILFGIITLLSGKIQI